MSKPPHRPSTSTAPFGPMLLMRWMLLLVLAVDLIGSPFHAHHHEGGPDGYAAHAQQLGGAHAFAQMHDGDETTLHVDADEAAHFGHSLSALRSAPCELADAKSQMDPPVLAPLFSLTGLLPPTSEGVVRWRPGRERVPIPLFRALPPDSRAPPTLHA